MNIDTVNECLELSLAGKITFPEVVMRLTSSGVERYIVDLIALRKVTYGINDKIHISELPFDAPPVSQEFEVEEVKLALQEIVNKQIDYQTFLSRIILAGCCHYEVFIVGRKAIYFGRDGSHHTEQFPAIAH